MSETYITEDSYPIDTLDDDLDREVQTQRRAGAINVWIEKKDNEIILYAEWEQS